MKLVIGVFFFSMYLVEFFSLNCNFDGITHFPVSKDLEWDEGRAGSEMKTCRLKHHYCAQLIYSNSIVEARYPP